LKNILQYHQVKSKEELTGCEYYRQIIPHEALRQTGEYDIQSSNTLKGLTDEQLSQYDFVHFIRRDFNRHIARCKSLGVRTVFDVDDYWVLHDTHPLKKKWIELGYAQNCVDSMMMADYVTCSTNKLAEEVRIYRPDVIVIPNCILPEEPQFKNIIYPETDKLIIGWIGASSHGLDIEMLKESMAKVWTDPDIKDKIKFVIGGYVNGHPIYTKMVYDISGGGIKHGIDNIILLPPTTVDSFAYMYDNCHVMLAPLKKGLFNECKSELKVVEAGWKGKCVIASDVEPYNSFENIITVQERKAHKDWYKAIKHLVMNPHIVLDLQNKLYDEVTTKHNMYDHIWKLNEIYQTTKS
jgi:glycosyltransferase involved in cell wall biosynthesis